MKPGTPLPWHTEHDGDPVVIGDSSGNFAAMTLPCEADIATQDDYDRATFIVHAANLYPELVAALDRMAVGVSQESSSTCEYYEGLEWDSLAEARALLAKVDAE